MSDLATTVRNQFFSTWPELLEYQDTIHVIYPGFHRSHNRSPENIVEEILKESQAGKTKFVFLEAIEALMEYDIPRLDAILELLNGKIAPSDIFYWTSAIDSEQNYKLSHNKVNVISSFYWEKLFDYSKDWPNKNYDIRIKDKNFLCLNHLQREHRIRLLNKLLPTGLIDKSFYSFVGHGDMQEFAKSLPDDEHEFKASYYYVKVNSNLLPMDLNYRITGEDAGKIIMSDLEYYENSYFSLVTETIFFKERGHHAYETNDRLFLTEKTFKPIFAQHPFLILASEGHLSALRDLGYKTFHPYIDETYDTIEDDYTRLETIIEEIKRLCNQTEEEWIKWQTNVKEIVEFNKQHFLARTDHRITKDIVKHFI
jgi:hypothetical protein